MELKELLIFWEKNRNVNKKNNKNIGKDCIETLQFYFNKAIEIGSNRIRIAPLSPRQKDNFNKLCKKLNLHTKVKYFWYGGGYCGDEIIIKLNKRNIKKLYKFLKDSDKE